MLFAVMIWRTGLLNIDPLRGVIGKLVEAKMNLPAEQLFWRAVLANWLVCLGVWMAARVKDDTARLLMVWWCMFTFVSCGYEHSVANMCGLLLGLLLPHQGLAITWQGYAYNLGLATVGNVIGGTVFVAGMYWAGSARGRSAVAEVAPSPNGFASRALEPVGSGR
jgi:nitrite transporter NirC